jgi:hypothetical protein
MPNERDRDELDREPRDTEDDTRGLEDEAFEDEGDEEDLEDEDELDADERITGEVGSEGGSPGENVRTRQRREPARGSEATETVRRQP